MTFTLLVCGGLAWSDKERSHSALDRALAKYPDLRIVQGGARGADSIARAWAESRGLPCITCFEDWRKVGKFAGMRRNQQMLVDHKPNGVLAFPGGDGTAHMVQIARAAGVPVWQPFATDP